MKITIGAILGYLLQTERKAAGLSQVRLAQLAQIHQASLSRIERGGQEDLGVSTLIRITDAMNVHGVRKVSPGELVENASTIWHDLEERAQRGDIPSEFESSSKGGATAVIGGAALGALILWLATRGR